MKSSYLLLLVFTLSISTLFSQAIDYRAYMYPEVSRRAMDINGSINQDNANKYNFINAGYEKNIIGLNGLLNHTSFTNSANRQTQTNGSINLNFRSARSSSINPSFDNIRNTSLSFNPRFSRIVRNFDADNKFWEHKYAGSISSFNRFYSSDSGNAPDNSHLLLTGFNYSIKRGKGRIEFISDVFLASNIIEELYEQGVLEAPLSQSQLFDFANKIAEMQNARIFDSRRYRVEVTKQLSAWLAEQNVLKENSCIEVATTVADNWMFGLINNRTNGKRYAVSLTPSLLISDDNFAGDNQSITANADLAFEYSVHTPKSRIYQVNNIFVGGIEVSKSYYDSDSRFDYGTVITAYATYRHEMGWNLSSRTFINFNPQATVYLSDIGDRNDVIPSLISNINISYFINFQTRLTLNGNLGYYFNTKNPISIAGFNSLSDNNLETFGTLGRNNLLLPNSYISSVPNQAFNSNIQVSLNHIFY